MAGRKDKNIVDYFPHYCIGGKTMFIIESKFSHLGYSIWFKTLELLGQSENHYIDLREETDLLFLISKLKITESEFNSIYDLLSKLNAIDSYLWSKKIIFSENFIKNIDDAYARRKNKCMQKCDLCIHLFNKCDNKCANNKHKSTKERKVKESKEKESTFNFKDSLLELGIENSIVESWLKVRKTKKAVNTEIAFNGIITQIEKSGLTPNECIKLSVENSWAGFKAEWVPNELQNNIDFKPFK